MADTTRVTITFKDRYENSFRIVVHFPGILTDPLDGLITGLVTLINLVTSAYGLQIEISQVTAPALTGAATELSAAENKCLLSYLDASGAAHNFRVPGPKTTCFLSVDHETADVAGPPGGISTALIGFFSGPDGALITSYTEGHRTMNRRTLKR